MIGYLKALLRRGTESGRTPVASEVGSVGGSENHGHDIAQIPVKAAVLTEEEGTMSGDLDVRVDDTGKGLVRYRDTETWYTIGRFDDAEQPRTFRTAAELAAAVEAGVGERDAAGNTVPFAA